MAFLYGVGGSARSVADMFVGVDGVARKVKAAYIGVDGRARLFFGGEYEPQINEIVEQCAGTGSNILSSVVYPAGRYKVEIAGCPATDTVNYSSDNCFEYTASVTQPFTIVAYCGDTATMTSLGFPYGASCNGGIFGGGGGADASLSGVAAATDGNSLNAYGAVCHFVPVGGTFGTDYLWCFHCAPTPKGGAYGGGCGGRGAMIRRPGSTSITTLAGTAGGAGSGGAGGLGGVGTINGQIGSGANGRPGTSGNGVGAGTATKGGVAVYNGLVWSEPTRLNVSRNASYVRVTYLGRN